MQSNNVTNTVACQWYLARVRVKSGFLDLGVQYNFLVLVSGSALAFAG